MEKLELSMLVCQPVLRETPEQMMLMICDVRVVQLKPYPLEIQRSTLRDDFLMMLAFPPAARLLSFWTLT